jgi:alpha-methylacyl-CoA racemase
VAIEPKFYARLLELAGISPDALPHSGNRDEWPRLKAQLAAVIKTKTRDQWCALLEGTDACFAPVLDLDEAPSHPHNQARHTFAGVDGGVPPNPAPRFSRTPTEIKGPPSAPGGQTDEVLADWGFSPAEVAGLREKGVIGRARPTVKN